MDENRKENTADSKGEGERSSSSSRRNKRRRSRRRKGAQAAAVDAWGRSAQPKRNTQDQDAARRRTNGAKPNSRDNKNQRNARRDESRESNRKGSRNRRRRSGRRGRSSGSRVGTLVDATGKLIPKQPPLAEPIDINAELQGNMKRHREEIAALKQEEHICVLCRKRIQDRVTAIVHKDGKGLCHFACVRKSILKTEKLEENEKLIYIGSGDYAIFQVRENRGKAYHFLRKRIEYQETGTERRGQG